MRRLIVPILIASVSIWMVSAGALAKGAPFKGYVVESSKPIAQTTGNCPCNMNTFTIGAKPGTLRVTAALKGFALQFTTIYGIRLRLYDGKKFVIAGQAACRTSQKRCNQAVTLKTKVKSSTVFYLYVEGPGAQEVHYTLRVTGSLRLLHCRAGICS